MELHEEIIELAGRLEYLVAEPEPPPMIERMLLSAQLLTLEKQIARTLETLEEQDES